MKVGTYVLSHCGVKGIVVAILTYKPRKPIRVCWLNEIPTSHRCGYTKVTTSVVWQNSVTIISEGE